MKLFYPDEVETVEEKIQYVIDVYGIKDEDANLLKLVIKDIALQNSEHKVNAAWTWLAKQNDITAYDNRLGDCYKAHAVLIALKMVAD